MKVHIKYEADISNCYECPFTSSVTEQGFCADICNLIGGYEGKIPDRGIHEHCPFRKDIEKGPAAINTNNGNKIPSNYKVIKIVYKIFQKTT